MNTIIKLGDTCYNGAVVIAVKESWTPDDYVVLCLWQMDTQTDLEHPVKRTSDPYVTWKAYVNKFGAIICQNGHYYDDFKQAVNDFDSRI